jgi:hypothetical protein
LNADGIVDTTFHNVTGLNRTVLSTALQPDGKIIIGDDFNTVDGDLNI